MPIPSTTSNIENEKPTSVSSAERSADKMFVASVDEKKMPHLLNQLDLNDIVRDLSLVKEKAELLSSRIQRCKSTLRWYLNFIIP